MPFFRSRPRSELIRLAVYRAVPGSWSSPTRRLWFRSPLALAQSSRAEGSKRRTNQDFARFLKISEGSMSEVGDLLLRSKDLLPDSVLEPIAREA